MTATRLLLIVGFLIAMTLMWRPFLTQAPLAPIAEEAPLAQPEYVATDLAQTAYNQNGQISYYVTADKMMVFPDLEFSHFEKPTFTLHSGEHNWQITADDATLYDDERLVLDGNVLAINLMDAAMIEQISGDHVLVNIKQKLMSSDHSVLITGPHLEISGKGLNADLNKQTIQLLNHTQTTYYDQ